MVVLGFGAFLLQLVWYGLGNTPIIILDWDRGHYMDAARRFLESGTPYLPWEVAGPFDYTPLTFLHPPVALWLMTPFAFLPPLAWYIVPVALLAWRFAAWRPSPLAWAAIALCLAWPRSPGMVIAGNSDVWAAAIVALGLRFGWPGPLMLLKPSFIPLALAGIHTGRRWWAGWILVAALSVPFGALWFDWIRVVMNAPGDLLYSALAIPGVAMPVFAWLGRRR